jgi:hypothetical protein
MNDVMRRAVQLANSDQEEVHMEGRIARLGSDVAHIQNDIAEIKATLRGLEHKVDGLRDKTDRRMEDLRDKMKAG